jgi:phosphoglycolate phosphatase
MAEVKGMAGGVRLLITDLDNTLYDWVTYFSTAFEGFAQSLACELGVPFDDLLEEFKAVHQRYGNSEQPFAFAELPSVMRLNRGASRRQICDRYAPALDEFNRLRKLHLRLYPGVDHGLAALKGAGITIVGHTEALPENAYYRLLFLGIRDCFKKLYALEGEIAPHPYEEREVYYRPPPGYLERVPRIERKPNPRLLLDICSRLQVLPEQALYVGDSLTRDVAMARSANVRAIWARYGTVYDKRLWSLLVRVTHWSSADVAREAELRRLSAEVQPDFTANSFEDVVGYVLGAKSRSAAAGE